MYKGKFREADNIDNFELFKFLTPLPSEIVFHFVLAPSPWLSFRLAVAGPRGTRARPPGQNTIILVYTFTAKLCRPNIKKKKKIEISDSVYNVCDRSN